MSKLINKRKQIKRSFKDHFKTPLQAFIIVGCMLIALIILLLPAIIYLYMRLEVL